MLARRYGTERGAEAIEHIGLIVIVAILIAALVAAFLAAGLQETVAAQLCRFFNTITGQSTASCGTGGVRSAEDHKPPQPCVVSSIGGGSGARVSVFIVTAEGGATWTIEELSNGEYVVTLEGEGGLAASGSVGARVSVTVDDKTYGDGVFIGVDKGVRIAGGQSFNAPSLDAAYEIIAQQTQDTVKDIYTFGGNNFFRDGVDKFLSIFGDDQEYEKLEPDEWFVEGGVSLSAYGDGGFRLPGMGAYAGSELEGGVFAGSTHRRDGTRTDYLEVEVSGSGNVGGSAGYYSLDAGASFEGSALVEIDRDANGDPTAMRLVYSYGGSAEYEGSGQAGAGVNGFTARTVEIPLDSESSRAVAGNLLRSMAIPYVPGLTDLGDPNSPTIPIVGFGPALDDFYDLAYERGYVSEQDYTKDTTTDFGLQADLSIPYAVKVGGGFGVEATHTEMLSTGARYATGPGEWVEMPECVAQP
jgi:hypothetical protein